MYKDFILKTTTIKPLTQHFQSITSCLLIWIKEVKYLNKYVLSLYNTTYCIVKESQPPLIPLYFTENMEKGCDSLLKYVNIHRNALYTEVAQFSRAWRSICGITTFTL